MKSSCQDKCSRCGRDTDIEKHHIIQKRDGGSNDPENKEPLCRACHDFEHAKRDIEEKLNDEIQKDRIDILLLRLKVLNELNAPEIIFSTGKYTSYWINELCRVPLPPKENIKKKGYRQEVMELNI